MDNDDLFDEMFYQATMQQRRSDSAVDWDKLRTDQRIEELEAENERLTDILTKLRTWINAYPVDIFPEPDLKKAAKVLKDNDMTLDSISASNFRFLLGRMLETLED